MEEISFSDVFTIEDLISDQRITSLVGNSNLNHKSSLSSTLQQSSIAFTIKEFDIQTKITTTDLFVSQSNNTIRQLTRNPKGINSYEPEFAIGSHEGLFQDSILYLKNGQLWQIPICGGESIQISRFRLPVETFRFFYGFDGQPYLLVVIGVYVSKENRCSNTNDSNNSLLETVEMDEKMKKEGSSGIVFDKLMVRHWDNWGTYRKRNHLFLCKLDITPDGIFITKEENLIDIMYGLESDCPGKGPGQGKEEFSISSDGKTIAFAARRTTDQNQITSNNGNNHNIHKQRHDFAWSSGVVIYMMDIYNLIEQYHSRNKVISTSMKEISDSSLDAMNGHPTFSLDGTKVAFLSMKQPQYESDKFRISIYDIQTNYLVNLTEEIDLSFQSIEWGRNNRELYVTAQYHAVCRLFCIQISEYNILESIHTMIGNSSKSSIVYVSNPSSSSSSSSSTLYYLESSLVKPNEIKAIDEVDISHQFIPFSYRNPTVEEIIEEDGNDIRYVKEVYNPCPSYINGDKSLSKPTQHYFEGGMKELVHCWYIPPNSLFDYENHHDTTSHSKKYPLLLIVHGGPQGAILNSWSYRWNMSLFASQGYAVVAVNFHGSTGFGQAFVDSIRHDWGGKPYEDCMNCVDYILSTYSYLDHDKIAALGASYGGYMMNWINGHTNRFKCLVNHDGIFSLKSLYYATDEIWFPEWEFGKPWENEEEYHKWSPESYVNNWKTPTLVVQGGIDYRVCETESISTFTALQRQGVDSRLLFFPDENHWVLKPMNSFKWYKTVLEWLTKYLT